MNDTNASQTLYNKMTETPIPGLILRLSIPTIVSMLITAIYNTADTFFVSQLGTSAAGAAGIVFAIMAIIQSVGFMLGLGAGSQVSRTLGAKDTEKANRLGSASFFMAILCGIIIALIGHIFMAPILQLLGATPTILPYAADYARFILLGAPIMCASYVLNNLLRAEGKANYSMIGFIVGGGLNIILDPVFIFQFQLGIAGAAIATVLSQCISFGILLAIFLRGKTTVRLHIKYLSRTFDLYRSIMVMGLPSFARQGLASAATAILNAQAAVYGDSAVAAMSIVSRLFMLIFSVIIGLGQGFQPVAGHNYGAKKYARVREAILFSAKIGTLVLIGLCLILFLLAPNIMTLFRADDPEVIAIGAFSIRFLCFTTPFMASYTISNMAFQVLGRPTIATVLSSSRQGIFFLPLIVILPLVLGLKGVQIAQPIADILSFALCLFFVIPLLKELKILEKNSKEDHHEI